MFVDLLLIVTPTVGFCICSIINGTGVSKMNSNMAILYFL